MLLKSLITILTFVLIASSSVLDIYDSYEFDEADSVISSVYLGPLIATGGAMVEINKLIVTMEPTNIGTIEPNKIILIEEDVKDEIYSFNKVEYYKVTKGIETFYVMSISAKKENVSYEIVVEFRKGPNYDRTLTIFKESQPITLILWIETLRVTPKFKDI